MKIDEALYQIKQRIKMHELEGTTSNENEREKALLNYIAYLQRKEYNNSKAIEYINKYLPNYDFDKSNLKYLLNILKGE